MQKLVYLAIFDDWYIRCSHAHRRVQQGTLGNFFFLGDFKHNFDAENDGAGRFLKKRPESGFLGPGGQVGVKKGVKISLPRKTAN